MTILRTGEEVGNCWFVSNVAMLTKYNISPATMTNGIFLVMYVCEA